MVSLSASGDCSDLDGFSDCSLFDRSEAIAGASPVSDDASAPLVVSPDPDAAMRTFLRRAEADYEQLEAAEADRVSIPSEDANLEEHLIVQFPNFVLRCPHVLVHGLCVHIIPVC